MDSPGFYALIYAGTGDFSITTAGSYVGDWLSDLDGMTSMRVQLSLQAVSPGASIIAYVQTSLDGGVTAVDIAAIAFTGSAVTALAFAVDAVTAFTPGDGVMSAGTVQAGILGDRVRLKVVSTGTYANTVLAGRVVVS
jgi:hypothetical protein